MARLIDNPDVLNWYQKYKRLQTPAVPPMDLGLSDPLAAETAVDVPSVPPIQIPQSSDVVPEVVPTPKPSAVPAPIKPPPTSWTEALGMGLSGYGDALLASAGRGGTALHNTMAGVQARKENELEMAKAVQEKSQGLKLQEARNVTARNLLAKYTGKDPKEFASMDADTIVKMLPLIEKTLPKQLTPEEAESKAFEKEYKAQTLAMRAKDLGLKEEKQAGALDLEMGKKFITVLNQQKPEAESARGAMAMISKIEGLLKPGTTGIEGKLKSDLAPLAQMFGANWQTMDDAAKVQILGRTTIGKMRLDLIGPGPVSEYEQKILSQLSGGGTTPLAATKELMAYYRKLGQAKIDAYHSTIKSASKIDPKFSEIYSRIEEEPKSAPAAGGASNEVERTTKDGQIAIFDATTKKFLRYKK